MPARPNLAPNFPSGASSILNQMPEHEIATLGGGCFWCLEAVYGRMEGIQTVQSGYMGGRVADPSYQAVCTGQTGHIEVVRLTYDPEVTSFRDILEVFFSIHDPTTFDHQGNDRGPQYRSAIFYHDDAQRSAAESLIAELTAGKVWHDPIVTEIRPASTFYVAEEYHQEYFKNNPLQPYCAYVVAPKLRKFREKFAAKLRQEA
jgi:peptide-methionine (S)-S-oxide reductase